MSIGKQILQQMGRHCLGKHLKMAAKQNCVLIHFVSVNQATYARKFHRVAHPVLVTPETARKNLVELQSIRCRRRTGRSGLPLSKFLD